jgi:hypothetical protein
MRLTHALLVIVDISGYTDFITNRSVSLLHAEQIITDLMESVIDRAEHPLTVNKLEGDAALLFREYLPEAGSACTRDVLAQVAGFFAAFEACLAGVTEKRSFCSCEACGSTTQLKLKAFLHTGEIAVKQVRQFEELAGEDVILIHRLLKNTVPEREYVLMTDAVRALAPDAVPMLRAHQEIVEGVGAMTVWLVSPDGLPAPAPTHARAAAARDGETTYDRADTFHHLPARAPRGLRGLLGAVRARFSGK